jgi:hypothetical protein
VRAAVLPGPRQGDLTGLEIQPVPGAALRDVASFLNKWQTHREDGSSVQGAVREDTRTVESRLQWLLLENPLATAAPQHGLWIRNASGAIMGLLLAFPGVFLAGDRRLLGLGSGSFFVEPQARTLGFYLFRRYLNSPGFSFFFSTSCNANSAPLWETAGACAVPNSDTEYVLPLNLEVLLPEFLSGKTSSACAAGIARVVGRWANPLFQRLARKSVDLSVEPCRDWEKLAGLFRRHRPADRITTDRSAVFLQWRYGPRADNHPLDICVFRDKRGNEGWFSLGRIIRGRQRRIRGCVLLDAVWPREKLSFEDILPAIRQRLAFKADALFLRPRSGLDYGEASRLLIPCRLEAPSVFAIASKDGPQWTASALDLVPADGEGAI